jgi:hypothetical protein
MADGFNAEEPEDDATFRNDSADGLSVLAMETLNRTTYVGARSNLSGT